MEVSREQEPPSPSLPPCSPYSCSFHQHQSPLLHWAPSLYPATPWSLRVTTGTAACPRTPAVPGSWRVQQAAFSVLLTQQCHPRNVPTETMCGC